jgi:hypothetical protein
MQDAATKMIGRLGQRADGFSVLASALRVLSERA